MNRTHVILNGVMEKIDVKIDGFEDRLLLQKSIYLLQILGLDLGYRYSWYIHGPYCPSLTADAYEVKRELEKGTEFGRLKFNEIGDQILEKHKRMLEKKPSNLSKVKWAELLTSLHYVNHVQPFPNKVNDVVTKVCELKDFNLENANHAWAVLVEYNLDTNKTLKHLYINGKNDTD